MLGILKKVDEILLAEMVSGIQNQKIFNSHPYPIAEFWFMWGPTSYLLGCLSMILAVVHPTVASVVVFITFNLCLQVFLVAYIRHLYLSAKSVVQNDQEGQINSMNAGEQGGGKPSVFLRRAIMRSMHHNCS